MSAAARPRIEPGSLRCVGVMWARGSGSTLHRKNLYPVLGAPLLAHSLRTIAESRIADQFYVFSEDDEIAAVTESFGFRVIPRPEHLVDFTHPRWDPDEAMHVIADFILADLGRVRPLEGGSWRAKWLAAADLFLAYNCNNLTLKPSTLVALRDAILAMEDVEKVCPAVRVDPPLYVETVQGLVPVLGERGGACIGRPPIYRMLGNTSVHMPARFAAGKRRQTVVEIPEDEGLDVHSREDVALAEAVLLSRRGSRTGAA